jgi:hypothetical protein
MSNKVSKLDRQRQRAAKGQSLFREVNERTEDLSASASFTTFICECMDESCDQNVAVTIEEYEHLRSDANTFMVLPGHDVPEVEEIIETTDRYVIVSKLGVGKAVAVRLDPRSRTFNGRVAPSGVTMTPLRVGRSVVVPPSQAKTSKTK